MESFSERINRQYAEKREVAMENKSKIDVHFIELYIKKMYGEDLSKYYLVKYQYYYRYNYNYF